MTTAPKPKSACEVFEQAKRLSLAEDRDGLADLFAPDGIHELPFAPPGIPGGWRAAKRCAGTSPPSPARP